MQMKIAHQVCKTHACNLGTLHDALLGEHRDIRLQLSNNRILQTTNTRAYAGDCIREETRRRRLSCINRGANAYRQWPSALGLEDV